jgi:phospholipid N-methyltransferase
MNAIALQSTLASTHAPGHWVLARLGKKVLRPGGLGATRRLLSTLAVGPGDEVVEFAPGLGLTARMLVAARPSTYTAVERDEAAARSLQASLKGARVLNGCAESSGLPDACADVVVGEAMLTMQPVEKKRLIIAEAARLLRAGGRYGIHEIALAPEGISEEERRRIRASMSSAIHHGVMAQTVGEWRGLLEEAGFSDLDVVLVPFHLLEPARLVADEGVLGAARIALNIIRMPDARARVLEMRRTFRANINNLSAIIITARKGI